jgi:hypothetical protein
MKALQKDFPKQYIEPAVDLLETMSLSGKPEVLGSAADRTIIYSADLDAHDTVAWSSDLPQRFRTMVASLNVMKDVRITDIKAGIVPEWNILETAHLTKGVVLNYNYSAAMDILESLYNRGIISKEEYDESRPLLKPNISPMDFLIAQKSLRFGIVRWTPKDVKAGFVKLRNGVTLSLADAMLQKTILKVDVIYWIENRFVECEMLYQIKVKGKFLISETADEIKQAIKENLLYYASQGNWMKVAKRMYSLSRLDKATTIQDVLRQKIFNSDLGRLYSVLSDAKSLEDLKEGKKEPGDTARIHQEEDGFRARLALITLPPLIKPVDPFTKNFIDKIEGVLQPRVKAQLKELHLLPLPKKWVA